MSIQANVNQIISLSTLLMTQLPQYKAAAEKRTELSRIDKQEKILAKREAAAKERHGQTGEILKEKAELAEARYKIDPSVETSENVAIARERAANIPAHESGDEIQASWTFPAEPEEIEREMEMNEVQRTAADNALQAEQQSKRITRARAGTIDLRTGRIQGGI